MSILNLKFYNLWHSLILALFLSHMNQIIISLDDLDFPSIPTHVIPKHVSEKAAG